MLQLALSLLLMAGPPPVAAAQGVELPAQVSAQAGAQGVPAQPAAAIVPGPAEAIEWAAADIVAVDEPSRPWKRYVWIPPFAEKSWPGLVSYAVNLSASHSQVVQVPTPVSGGQLLRWDLRLLAPDPTELARLVALWDSLAVGEPYFHVTQGTSAVFAPHCPAAEAKILATHTRSAAPVLRADWFVIRLLTTIQGGRYYEFRGIERQPKGRTAKQAWLSRFGADESDSDRLGGDQRKACFVSEVTGKPRLVEMIRGRGGRHGEGRIWLTFDSADEDVKPNQHPLLNLLRFDSRATEAIAELPNGLHEFALFDAAGNLQNSVPDNIAADHTIPAPHTRRLEPAISCIRCHGPEDGLKPVRNDVTALLARGPGSVSFTVLDDVGTKGGKRLSPAEAMDAIAGKYAGGDNFDRKLARGRDDYSEAVWRAVGGGDGESVAKSTAAALSDLVAGYRYAKPTQAGYVQVTPDQAAIELGYRCQPGKGREALSVLLATPAGNVDDPRIAALKQGVAITRADFEAIYADAAIRAQANMEAMGDE